MKITNDSLILYRIQIIFIFSHSFAISIPRVQAVEINQAASVPMEDSPPFKIHSDYVPGAIISRIQIIFSR